MKLVIVESPAKAKKIAGYLGENWRVEACRGHVRDLPATELGVNVNQDFRPQYVVLPCKGNLVRKLVKAMQQADAVYLATDPDREGEAIAWHLLQLAGDMKGKPVYRAAFQAITESAVRKALDEPRLLNQALVDAQGARRVVDRLVGYLVSPLAGKALKGRLSAGRVQSVALRLLVEREHQIEGFTSETYYTLRAVLEAGGMQFDARLHRLKDGGVRFTSRESAEKLAGLLKDARFHVSKAGDRLKLYSPPPPFTTASLQQAASKGLQMSPEKTMTLAQTLYEQGRITYHRTDAVHIAPEAQTAAREIIGREYGEAYLPPAPPTYKTKAKSAQEAHEAIRPTDPARMPDDGKGLGAKLYDLIWRRFIASQMTPARYNFTGALIQAGKSQERPLPLVFRAQGRVRLFDGYLRVYKEPDDVGAADEGEESAIPALKEGQALKLVDLAVDQSQTRPLSRFTEAGLVARLEYLGVGRPSTYALMLKTLKDRNYVTLKQRRLVPTETGVRLCDFVVKRFPGVFDVGYTARLEAALDRVASGEMSRLELLSSFWRSFQPQLKAAAEQTLEELKPRQRTKPLVLRARREA